ncbi:GNAT family N-acetyltransferase [Photobacterium minamisatsumaniensis]|uniref:GNAT family N-acetyltransferase n=1 Tax=Photobacterium minamisatsumaniensis TaxID=2910233 RepID=UPI003D099BB2
MAEEISFDEVKTNGQLESIVELASIIWGEHYTPIIGSAQVEYMLGKFQSYTALKDELKNNKVHYYVIERGGNLVGYSGVRLENNALFLSKLYVLSSERGKGAGKKAIGFMIQLAKINNKNLIYLTVNKENTGTIAAYEKMGFKIVSEVCADIGNGYVMDDYKMELEL